MTVAVQAAVAGVALLAACCAAPAHAAAAGPALRLDVPNVVQRPERCGPAALTMVLRWYGADSAAARADAAYDPALHGTLVTDLAAAARTAGFLAEVATLDPDALRAELAAGVPVIVLYQNGPSPVTVPHYGVVVGWEPAHRRFVVQDGSATPRRFAAADLERRWRRAGSQALVVRRRADAPGDRSVPGAR